MTSTVDIFTHRGSFGPSTRSVPALAFYEKYATHVQAVNLTGHFSDFYAPSAVFLNGDGEIYRGGNTIWEWMKELFGPFERLGFEHEMIMVLPLDNNDDGEPGRKQGWRILTEHVMTAYLKGELAGEGIPVRRAMSWVVGPSEEEGTGTDGLQWFEGKVWWDTAVVGREVDRRRKELEVKRSQFSG